MKPDKDDSFGDGNLVVVSINPIVPYSNINWVYWVDDVIIDWRICSYTEKSVKKNTLIEGNVDEFSTRGKAISLKRNSKF